MDRISNDVLAFCLSRETLLSFCIYHIFDIINHDSLDKFSSSFNQNI
ncbi:MAG: hypothetical protein WCG25_05045 [bacterium]